jgi:hypothetical protein
MNNECSVVLQLRILLYSLDMLSLPSAGMIIYEYRMSSMQRV